MGPALSTAPFAMPERAQRLTDTFEAFRIRGNGASLNQFTKKTRYLQPEPVQLPPVATLDEAAQEAAPHCEHKDTFVVRRETPDGEVTHHFYAVKRKSQPMWVWRDHERVRVHRLYAEPLFSIAGGLE